MKVALALTDASPSRACTKTVISLWQTESGVHDQETSPLAGATWSASGYLSAFPEQEVTEIETVAPGMVCAQTLT